MEDVAGEVTTEEVAGAHDNGENPAKCVEANPNDDSMEIDSYSELDDAEDSVST